MRLAYMCIGFFGMFLVKSLMLGDFTGGVFWLILLGGSIYVAVKTRVE